MNPWFADPRAERAEALTFEAEAAERRRYWQTARVMYLDAAVLLESVTADVTDDYPNTRRDLARSAAACRDRAARILATNPGDIMSTCNYKPTQGRFKEQPCLLALYHDGPHIHEADKLPPPAPPVDPAAAEALSDQEIDDVITDEEIRKRSQALNDAQEIWERAHARAEPKMPCPECTANGQVVGGSLGDHCPTCHGQRTVRDDAVEFEFEMPPFAELRGAVSAYGDALALRRYGLPGGIAALPPGSPARVRGEADYEKRRTLPPASTVPTMEAIQEIRDRGRAKHKELAGGAPAQPLLPPAGKLRRSGLETEGGVEDTATDAELAELEDEAEDASGAPD